MTPSREETYHLLTISRHGTTTASKPTIAALLGRKLIERMERPEGGYFRDRYTLTAEGFDALLDSKHFDAARMKLDAEQRLDGDEIVVTEEA